VFYLINICGVKLQNYSHTQLSTNNSNKLRVVYDYIIVYHILIADNLYLLIWTKYVIYFNCFVKEDVGYQNIFVSRL
jgi:hypothetical protein